MWKMRWRRILLNIKLNASVHRARGSLRSSQLYRNTETHLRPLPPHSRIATQIQLSVVPLLSYAHQQPHIKARALNGLRPPPHQSQQACSNNSLDYTLKRKQHLLNSGASRANSPLAYHSSNAQQQICRTLPARPPIRTVN